MNRYLLLIFICINIFASCLLVYGYESVLSEIQSKIYLLYTLLSEAITFIIKLAKGGLK